MAGATLNGENLVKLSKKMVGKLGGFLKKVGDGLTTIPYIPGAVFEIAKFNKEEKQNAKEEIEKAIKNEKNEKQTDKNQEEMASLSKRVDEFVKEETEKKTATTDNLQLQSISNETHPKESLKKIQGKSAADFLKDIKKETKEEKENKPAQPENVEIKPQTKQDDKKEKKNLTDLTIFNSYEDYKYAFFWNYYINKKEFDRVQLDAVAKLQARTADVKFYRTILTEGNFNAKKAEQLKEKEIDSIRKAEAEKNAKLDAERDAAIQKAKDDAQSTIDTLQAKLTESRSKNRVLTSKLKVNTEALTSIAEISTTIGGIKAIDDVITKADKKCQGIDGRAEEKEKNKEESKPKIEDTKKLDVEAETDKIMKSINEKVYGQKEEKADDEPAIQKLAQKEENAIETDSASLVNELASYDDKEIASPSIFDTAISSPKVELETVPFTPSWKLGSVENQMDVKNLSDAMSTEFNQIVDENTKSKGKTR